MNYVDYQVIIAIIIFALIGFKKGFLKSVISLVGFIIILILAFYLKNPLSEVLYMTMPFFKLDGYSVLNILVYEGIAFLVIFSLFMVAYKFIISLTNILSKTINFFLFFGLPSKILGALFGMVEGIVVVFLVFTVCIQLNYKADAIEESKYGSVIMHKSPVLSNVSKDAFATIQEIYDLHKTYENKDEFNEAVFELMLKNNVLSPNSARRLIEQEKLVIKNGEEIIKKYEGE